MKQLTRLILSNFLPIFFGALLFFTFLINASDLLFNVVRYIERQVPLSQVLQVQMLYLPTSVNFALPISLLFSVSFAMGTLHSNNELIAVFASGVSLKRFIIPLVVIGLLASATMFLLQDQLAIPSLKQKEELSGQLLRNRPVNLNRSNISIQSRGGRVVYDAAFYDDARRQLDEVQVIIRDDSLRIQSQLYASWAVWEDDRWVFQRVTLISLEGDDGVRISELDRWSDPLVNLDPQSFQNQFGDIDQMNIDEARDYLQYLRDGGFPYRRELTRYHERFSFSFTPLIVILLSAGIGGSFKKNILAMSLLVSLGLSIVYYSIQMLSGLFATLGLIDSIVGAWAGTLITGMAAAYIISRAKT
jgi:lipopolysaccharide export system permease protein